MTLVQIKTKNYFIVFSYRREERRLVHHLLCPGHRRYILRFHLRLVALKLALKKSDNKHKVFAKVNKEMKGMCILLPVLVGAPLVREQRY